MSLRFDSHVHSRFSPDGRDDLGAYARRIDAGGPGVGFAEHYEFWPGSDAFEFFDPVTYQGEVTRWRHRGYRFFAGVEVDWIPEYEPVLREALVHHRFDFVIASVHNLPSGSVSGRDRSFSAEPLFGSILDEYHGAVTSSLTVPEFDVVGHVGVYARHLDPAFVEKAPWKRRIQEAEDDLASRIAASGKLLEVNTSGLFCARGEPCAGRFLLERYRAHGGRYLSMGSDAHEAAHLGRGFAQAEALLQHLGFDLVFLPWDREHPVPLGT